MFAVGMRAGTLGEQGTRDRDPVGEGAQESLLLGPYSAQDHALVNLRDLI